MDASSSVKTPGDKNDADTMFRYRDVDGEGEVKDEEIVCDVDELYLKHIGGQRRSSTSPGKVPASLPPRKDDQHITLNEKSTNIICGQ